MNRTLIACFALVLSLSPLAATAEILPVEIVNDVVYGHKMGMALSFDVVKPSQANGAAVLFMVSGGWFSRYAPPAVMASRFEEVLNAGYTLFLVRHGSAPLFKVPDAVDDVRRATRFIRMNADEWGIDPERIGVTGGSAGGHLSLMLGTTGDDGDPTASDPVLRYPSHVAAVVAYFPPVDLTGITGPNDRFPALDFDPAVVQTVSPIFHVDSADPPSLMVHGTDDDLVPLSHSERILAAFQGEGVATELVVIEGAGHGFRDEQATTASQAMVRWFNAYLAARPDTTQATAAGGGGR